MEQISVAPPPLPPKTRRSPPESSTPATVLSPDVFSVYQDPEVISRQPTQNHVVKIRINPDKPASTDNVICELSPCITISVNNAEMVQNSAMVEKPGAYFFYNPFNLPVMSSGQVSPSETLDSGTCSDLDGTPPPLPKKMNASGVSVTMIQHKRASSLTSSGDSDDNESNISCDSLTSGKISPMIVTAIHKTQNQPQTQDSTASSLPETLLQDIRDRSSNSINIKSYEERAKEDEENVNNDSVDVVFDTDSFYKFHLNENDNISSAEIEKLSKNVEDESFAGYKDLLGDGASTIRSAKGTVRGVKNRVRAGIATFLQINSLDKNYKEKDAGKVVVYTTTMGILRETYQACMKVKQIMRTLLVKFEERDVFMSGDYQNEIKERMRCDFILVPQVFVDGQHVGDAETIERLNESGELRRMLKPFKSMDACNTCKVCGGYRLLPCQVCNGSKKSVHRNHFTTEFVALKCMNCDEVGLVKCTAC